MNLIANAQTNADAGGLVILVIAVGIYGLMALREWWSDVRYYRARDIVRKREG